MGTGTGVERPAFMIEQWPRLDGFPEEHASSGLFRVWDVRKISIVLVLIVALIVSAPRRALRRVRANGQVGSHCQAGNVVVMVSG
jgi:hypothetical protein